jgi:hypothetical protein
LSVQEALPFQLRKSYTAGRRPRKEEQVKTDLQIPEMATLADPRRRVDAELVESLCSALRKYLERQVGLLNEEVRNYPTPIARCDDQLTGLLEQRASAAAQLQRLNSLGAQDLARADGIALAGELIDLLLNRR